MSFGGVSIPIYNISMRTHRESLFLLLVFTLTACTKSAVGSLPTPNFYPLPTKTSTLITTIVKTTKPTETQSSSIEVTLTAEVTRNYPSFFAGLFFGIYLETDQPTIVIAVKGNTFERENPGCTVPTVNGSHESQLNVLYNPNIPDMAVGFMVDNNYLMSYFNASASKSGHTLGNLPNGTQVELTDNVWRIQKNNQT